MLFIRILQRPHVPGLKKHLQSALDQEPFSGTMKLNVSVNGYYELWVNLGTNVLDLASIALPLVSYFDFSHLSSVLIAFWHLSINESSRCQHILQ